MTEAEAEKAFREMLPVETIRPDISTLKVRKYDKPFQIIYERHDSLLTKVLIAVKSGERAITVYPIEKLRLSEN